jgi:hypothetical protein
MQSVTGPPSAWQGSYVDISSRNDIVAVELPMSFRATIHAYEQLSYRVDL